MNIPDNKIKLFVHRDVLLSEDSFAKFKKWLSLDAKFHLNNTSIDGIDENGLLNICYPPLARQNYSLFDPGFQRFMIRKANDDYLFGSLETFKKLVGD